MRHVDSSRESRFALYLQQRARGPENMPIGMHFRIAVIHHAPDLALVSFDFDGAAVDVKFTPVESAHTGPTGLSTAAYRQQGKQAKHTYHDRAQVDHGIALN